MTCPSFQYGPQGQQPWIRLVAMCGLYYLRLPGRKQPSLQSMHEESPKFDQISPKSLQIWPKKSPDLAKFGQIVSNLLRKVLNKSKNVSGYPGGQFFHPKASPDISPNPPILCRLVYSMILIRAECRLRQTCLQKLFYGLLSTMANCEHHFSWT